MSRKEGILPDKRARKRKDVAQKMSFDESPKRYLRKLGLFIEGVRVGKMDDPLLTGCTKAAFAKSFEFVEFSYSRMRNEHAFHFAAGLRSICEDLIILKFLSNFTAQEQEIAL